jgi:hypothetical protein
MPTPALVTEIDLYELEGTLFSDVAVAAAAARVRREAGWHIAPVITETLEVVSYGGQFLPLPTRRIVSIGAVRDPDGVTVTGWTKMAAGIYRKAGWSVGIMAVDLTHGYDAVPADLLPVLVQRVKAGLVASNVSQRSSTVGPFGESETYRDGVVADPVVADYAVYAGIA